MISIPNDRSTCVLLHLAYTEPCTNAVRCARQNKSPSCSPVSVTGLWTWQTRLLEAKRCTCEVAKTVRLAREHHLVPDLRRWAESSEDRNWRNRGEAAGGQGNKADGRHEPERKRVVHAQPAANQPKCELIRNQQTTLSIRAAQKPLVCGWWRYNAFLLLECCLVMRSASEAC